MAQELQPAGGATGRAGSDWGIAAGSSIHGSRRRLNEARAARATATFIELACECVAAGCRAVVPLTLAEFEGVRSVPGRFVVAPAHFDAAAERLVAGDRRFDVVAAR
jgi:hypothetical protein